MKKIKGKKRSAKKNCRVISKEDRSYQEKVVGLLIPFMEKLVLLDKNFDPNGSYAEYIAVHFLFSLMFKRHGLCEHALKEFCDLLYKDNLEQAKLNGSAGHIHN